MAENFERLAMHSFITSLSTRVEEAFVNQGSSRATRAVTLSEYLYVSIFLIKLLASDETTCQTPPVR